MIYASPAWWWQGVNWASDRKDETMLSFAIICVHYWNNSKWSRQQIVYSYDSDMVHVLRRLLLEKRSYKYNKYNTSITRPVLMSTYFQ